MVHFKRHPEVYPYLVTRIVSALYHIMVLPDSGKEELLAIALKQYLSNDLPQCLVLGEKKCIYFDRNGLHEGEVVPAGGNLWINGIKECFDDGEVYRTDTDYKKRFNKLRDMYHAEWEMTGTNILTGDPEKGGIPATIHDIAQLGGFNPENKAVPRGLTKCQVCSYWRGRCIDPSPDFKNKVMIVNCLCENKNKCASCGALFYKYKLNANYYTVEDGTIWHLPGFMAFKHEC